MLFLSFLADVQQLDLLALLTANRRLGSRCAFKRVAAGFLRIVAQGVVIENNHQRQAVGWDQRDAVLVVDMLFPERRQVNLHRVEEVSPFVGLIRRNAIAGDGAGDGINGVALLIQFQGDRRDAGAGRRYLLRLAEAIEILFDRLAFIIRKLAGRRVAKGLQ